MSPTIIISYAATHLASDRLGFRPSRQQPATRLDVALLRWEMQCRAALVAAGGVQQWRCAAVVGGQSHLEHRAGNTKIHQVSTCFTWKKLRDSRNKHLLSELGWLSRTSENSNETRQSVVNLERWTLRQLKLRWISLGKKTHGNSQIV